jgi:membrane-associated phospholipid phosphatase
MTLALCAVMVAPRRLRPLVATAGGLFALAVAYAVLVFVHHFPSDVVGGFFVAAIFTLLAVALLRRWPDPVHETAEAEREPPSLWPAVALAATSVIAGLALAFQHPSALATHLAGHPSFVIAAAAIAALAGVLAAVLARSARG